MPENLNVRVTRLEDLAERAFMAIEALADKEAKLDDALCALADAQIKTEHRFRQTDDRVDKLVSAIGELVSRSGAKN
jgi:hypothetical protein